MYRSFVLALLLASRGPHTGPPPPPPPPPTTLNVTAITADSGPLTNGADTGVPVTAACGPGTHLVGGGSFLYRLNGTQPGNGLKLNGSMASDATGAALPDGTANPSRWTAVSGFAALAETGDQATAFAMCATGGPTATVLKVTTAPPGAIAEEGNQPVKVTATCPTGTKLVGGGMQAGPNVIQSLKPIASYPSDATGNAAADGATDPQSWTVYAAAGVAPGVPGQEVVSAFAVCAKD